MGVGESQKRVPRFDFSALAEPPSVASARKWAAEAGQKQVVELPIGKVIEDPNNPRTTFNVEALQGLAQSIQKRGVMQPILVRERGKDGLHVIIQGARRFRGSKIAGKATVPAIIIPAAEMEFYDDYSQVIENVQRENLNAEELCEFIVKRLGLGDKKGDIAEKLGVSAKSISAHLAIRDLPTNVLALFRAGKINGIEPLYDFTRLQAQTPEVAARLIAEAEQNPLGEITLATIRKALKTAEHTEHPTTGQPAGSPENFSSSPTATNDIEQQGGEDQLPDTVSTHADEEKTPEMADFEAIPPTNPVTDNPVIEKGAPAPEDPLAIQTKPAASPAKVIELPFHNPANDKSKSGNDSRHIANPDFIKKPLLLGQIDGEPVKVLLTRRPSTPGLVFVSWEGTGQEEEVALDRIKLTLLSEMKLQESA